MYPPFRKVLANGVKPSSDSRLASVDFLTSPYEADDDSPIRMAIHVLDEKLWLGSIESRNVLSPFHEICGLGEVPSTLSLIEDDHSVVRCFARLAGTNALISKVVNDLDEWLHLLSDFAFSDAPIHELLTGELIPRQCLLQNRNERAISREEDGGDNGDISSSASRNIESDESLPGARHSSYEDNGLGFFSSRRVDD